jgi:hypothetical protein
MYINIYNIYIEAVVLSEGTTGGRRGKENVRE